MDRKLRLTYLLMLSKYAPWASPMPHQRLRYARGTLILATGEGDGLDIPAPTADWLEQWTK